MLAPFSLDVSTFPLEFFISNVCGKKDLLWFFFVRQSRAQIVSFFFGAEQQGGRTSEKCVKFKEP